MNMISLRLIGEYFGRVLFEVKQPHRYLVRDLIGFESASLQRRMPAMGDSERRWRGP
jgi:hypothetical protein